MKSMTSMILQIWKIENKKRNKMPCIQWFLQQIL